MVLLRRILIALLLLTGLLGILVWTYTLRALPQRSGEISVRGPLSRLSIERDANGIPTIRAGAAEDAWFGLGFAHAQDRLWQLELHRRIGSGRLAELFGREALGHDKFLRALGVRRAAQEQWAKADPLSRRALEAYSAGINAYVDEHMRARPPEFLVLGLQPEPWTPVDSLAWSIIMAWDLGGNWRSELLRLRLSLFLPAERIDELLPAYEGERPPQLRDYGELYTRLKLAGSGRPGSAAAAGSAPAAAGSAFWDALLQGGVEGLGSNNWAVSGRHSATGHPLVANDPHLRLSTPALWYLARLEAPGLRVAGATLPALPMVVLGQNEHLAWSFTNTFPDVQDLYVEQIDPRNPQRYRSGEGPEGWATFETFPERIGVRGEPDVVFVARRSRHGPIISDAESPATQGLTGTHPPRPEAPGYALALRWTALDPDTGTLAAGLGFNRARSVDEFIAAGSSYVAPMQNVIVADRRRIAQVSLGRVPLRKADNDLRGRVPAPGWDSRYDWAGFLPPAETPRELDPPRGWLASANQRIHGPSYPHEIGSDWSLPFRHRRIQQLLDSRPMHDLDSFAAMQRDQRSLFALALLDRLRAARSNHPLAPQARALLAGWDGRMEPDAAEPLIFWAWLRHLGRGVFADQIGAERYERELGVRSFHDALLGVLQRDDAWWCDDMGTPERESCTDQIDRALGVALEELERLQGHEPATWRWSRAHLARAEHRPFSKLPLLRPHFELQTPVGGDTYTLDATRVWLASDPASGLLPYQTEHAASLRLLMDVGDPRRSRVIHPSGQSGLVFSPSYRDFQPRWAKGQTVMLWPDTEPGQMLRLLPR